MYDISAIVKDSPNVLGVYGTSEVRVTVVSIVLFAVALSGVLRDLQEVVSDEVLGSSELSVGTLLLDLRQRLLRHHVVHELGEIVFQPGPAQRDLLL